MPKLYGMHHLELRPEVAPDAFERFVTDELSRLLHREGQRTYVLKGDRGERVGKYLFVIEYDTVERRDQDSPGSNQDSEELKQWLAEHEAQVGQLFAQLSTYVLPDWDIGYHYTDYVEVSREAG
jgi:hypothetical protein